MDVYTRLQKRLDEHPSGAPAADSFNNILKLLFSPEEAEIACQLTFTLQSPDKIVHKMGMAMAELKDTLDEMAERGCIMGVKIKDHDYYALLPILPGFYEFPFMRKEHNPHTQELARLWQQYLYEGFSKTFSGSSTPQMRVIPVQESIPNSSEILCYAQVTEMLDRVKLIAVTNCACKEIANACRKPREVCMAFDNSARYLLDKGWAREISREETLQIIKETEAEGMVHCVRNTQDKLTILCNCCSCCCMLLRAMIEINNPNSIAASAYIVKLNEEECIGCKACIEDRCPTYAIKSQHNVVAVQTEKCIGCGLCVTICPSNALTMKRRMIPPHIPATEKDLLTTLSREKGKQYSLKE